MTRNESNRQGSRGTSRSGVAALVVAAFLAITGGCATGGGLQVGDLNLVSIDEEWQLGRQIENDLSHELRLVHDPIALAALSRMGQEIVAQTAMARLPWEFHLVAAQEINAFNTPGGHVYVNTGLVRASRDAAELVGVISHEVGHGVERHGTERLTQAYGLNLLASFLLGENPGVGKQIAAQIVGSGSLAAFSRAAERQADEHGVYYMVRAGYDPDGMVQIFETLLDQRRRRPGQLAQFFSSHPLTEDRIRDVRQLADQVAGNQQLRMRDPDFRTLRGRV